MTYSVYARDRKSGREYALPQRYFGNLPTNADATVALAWYLETASASARDLVEVYILEHASIEVVAESINSKSLRRELAPA